MKKSRLEELGVMEMKEHALQSSARFFIKFIKTF
jgi:hypothetical protein